MARGPRVPPGSSRRTRRSGVAVASASAGSFLNCFLKRTSPSANSAGVSGVVHQLQFAVRRRCTRWCCWSTVLSDVGVAVEGEALAQQRALAGVVHKQRAHPALDREVRTRVGQVLGDAVLGAARRVDVHHRCALLVREHPHCGGEEVAVHRGRRGAREHAGVERGEQCEVLAALVLAVVRLAAPWRGRRLGR